jgi:Ca-activated chloride channel family protein
MIYLKKKILYFILVVFSLTFVLTGCSKAASPYLQSSYSPSSYLPSSDSTNNEGYLEITESDFVDTSVDAVSTFSLDTSTAGYANIRRMINQGVSISMDHVKLEEMVNYFNYDYTSPTGEDALAISSEIMTCPWNTKNKIVSIGVKAKEVDNVSNVKNNLVFLLDVSGSMDQPNKLQLMQSAFKLFVETLNDDDTISIVTYAGSEAIVLDGGKGYEKKRIVNLIEDLMAGGSTAGAAGIQTAYNLAEKYFIKDGNNRVIIGTDGDFNVGISRVTDLEEFISNKRKSNVYLSVLGFGYGNLQDSKLSTLANKGNGNYAYIDSITEARKVLVEEIGGTLNIVAKDTKTQVTFNPAYVSQYRLLGYENKLLTDEEFDDENADAGEIGAGHVTTAVYEVVLNENSQIASSMDNNWLKVLIRHKDPATQANKEVEKFVDITSEKTNPSEDMLFISGVLEFGLILRNSVHKGDASYQSIISRIQNLKALANDVYKMEFLDLVKKKAKL